VIDDFAATLTALFYCLLGIYGVARGLPQLAAKSQRLAEEVRLVVDKTV
jgi:hypothetical protein